MFVGMLQPGMDHALQDRAMEIVQSLAAAGGKIRASHLLADAAHSSTPASFKIRASHTSGRTVLRLLGFVQARLQREIREKRRELPLSLALETLIALSKQSEDFAVSLCAAGCVPLVLSIMLEEGETLGNWESPRSQLAANVLLSLVNAASSQTDAAALHVCVVLAPCFLQAPLVHESALEFVRFCQQDHDGWDSSVRANRRDVLRESLDAVNDEVARGSNGHGGSWTLERVRSDNIDFWDGKRKLFKFSG